MTLVERISDDLPEREFTAIVECEHCRNRETYTDCWPTPRWLHVVLPKRHCTRCGLNRGGMPLRDKPVRNAD